MSFKQRRQREMIARATLMAAGAGQGSSRRRCPKCFVGHCKIHPAQDHGKSRAVLHQKTMDKSAILEKLYKEQVSNRVNKMLLATEAQKTEAASYRSDMERKRVKASSRKRKNVDLTQLIGARPVSSGSDSDSDDSPPSRKKKRKDKEKEKRRGREGERKKKKNKKKKKKKKKKLAKSRSRNNTNIDTSTKSRSKQKRKKAEKNKNYHKKRSKRCSTSTSSSHSPSASSASPSPSPSPSSSESESEGHGPNPTRGCSERDSPVARAESNSRGSGNDENNHAANKSSGNDNVVADSSSCRETGRSSDSSTAKPTMSEITKAYSGTNQENER